jgi:hypothetical protein
VVGPGAQRPRDPVRARPRARGLHRRVLTRAPHGDAGPAPARPAASGRASGPTRPTR